MSDMSAGQIVGGIVGAVVGWFVTYTPAGVAQGFALGAGIGGYIDPPAGPNLRGPTIDDNSFQSSAYGVALPNLRGTIATMGNVIYLENNKYKAVPKKESTGGKGGGGGGTVTTTTYYATFAVALAQAMPGSRVRRIWAGGKLIFSAGQADFGTIVENANSQSGWKYYDGAQTVPDSRMESVLGVGNCPSYEGTAYIIFYDFDLTKYGNGLAGCPIKVEIICEDVSSGDLSPPELLIESSAEYPPTEYDEVYQVQRSSIAQICSLGANGTGAVAVALWKPVITTPVYATRISFSAPNSWIVSRTDFYDPSKNYVPGINMSLTAQRSYLDLGINVDIDNDGVPDYGAQYQEGVNGVWGAVSSSGDYLGLLMDGNNYGSSAFSGLAVSPYGAYVANDSYIRLIEGGSVASETATNNPTGVAYKLWFYEGNLYRMDALSEGGFKFWVYDGVTLEIVYDFVIPRNVPSMPDWQFSIVDGVIWIGYTTHPTFGDPDDGKAKVYIQLWSLPGAISNGERRSVRLSALCEDIISGTGITPAELDLSELESDFVDGYGTSGPSSARGDLAQLQVAYLFDLVEIGYKIEAKKRGGVAADVIRQEDLVAHNLGSDVGVLVSSSCEVSSRLPSRYKLTYMDYNREYDQNTQYADYPSLAENERNETLAIVMPADKAASLCDILINLAWVERRSFEFSVSQKFLGLKSSDVKTLEVSPGKFETVRIEAVSKGLNQVSKISARLAQQTVYQSTATGSDVEPPSETIPYISPAVALLMDVPLIYSSANNYGFGAAVYPEVNSGGWPGAVLLESKDFGQTYLPLQSFTGAATVASASNSLPPGDYAVIDYENELRVNVLSGQFFSITEEQMMTGKNYCAYGVDGRWEIIRYANASVNEDGSLTLSVFARGLFGTEWAGDLHTSSDLLVSVEDPDNAFISAEPSAVGVERYYQSVTVGASLNASAAKKFTYNGVNLKPLSPVHLKYVMVGDDFKVSFTRRSRMSSSLWVTGTEIPLGESSERYSVEILIDYVVVRIATVETAEFVYTSAMQFEDTGGLVSEFDIVICQISAAVGRGNPLNANIIRTGGDPSWSAVASLLHFDGDDDSTAIVDEKPVAWTVAGVNAKLSTEQKRWGASSLQVNGKESGVFTSAGLMLPTDDLTIECWIRIDSAQTGGTSIEGWRGCIVGQAGVGGGTGQLLGVFKDGANHKLRFFRGSLVGAIDIMGSTVITQDQWHFVQLIYDSVADVFSIWLDGVSQGSQSSASGWNNAANPVMIGRHTVTGLESYDIGFDGWIDDLRITKSSARSNAIPTGPFLDY